MRIETYVNILKIQEGQVIFESPKDFEKTLWRSATWLWKDTEIFTKKEFTVEKMVNSNNNELTKRTK